MDMGHWAFGNAKVMLTSLVYEALTIFFCVHSLFLRHKKDDTDSEENN